MSMSVLSFRIETLSTVSGRPATALTFGGGVDGSLCGVAPGTLGRLVVRQRPALGADVTGAAWLAEFRHNG